MLLEGISYFFSDVSKFKDSKMGQFMEILDKDKITEELKKIDELIKNPKFKELKKFLNDIQIGLESFPFYQEDMKSKDGENPEGDGGMYPKNFFEGQNILILMCFSSTFKSQKAALDYNIRKYYKKN